MTAGGDIAIGIVGLFVCMLAIYLRVRCDERREVQQANEMGAAFAAVLGKSKRSRHKGAQRMGGTTQGTTTSNPVDQENDTAAALAAILMESQRSRQGRLGTHEMARTAAFASGLLGSQQSGQEKDTEGGVAAGSQGTATAINYRRLQEQEMAAAFAAVLVASRGSSQHGFGTRAMAAAFAAGVVFGSKRTRQEDTQATIATQEEIMSTSSSFLDQNGIDNHHLQAQEISVATAIESR